MNTSIFQLFASGETALAIQQMSGMASMLDLARDLQSVVDHVPEQSAAHFLLEAAETIYRSAQTGNRGPLRQLEGDLSRFFQTLDDDSKRLLAEKLRHAVNDEEMRQTLTDMMREGRWREVGTLLSEQPAEALKKLPFLQIHFSLCLEQADFKTAGKIVNEMMALRPAHPQTYLCRAELALAEGEVIEADRMYNDAAHLGHQEFRHSRPLYDQFCLVCIRIFLAQGKLDEAQSQMNEWITNGSQDLLADRYYLQGLINERWPPRGARSPDAWIEGAARIFPQRADFQMALARIHFRKKKNDTAKTVLETLQSLDPLNPNIWLEMASLYIEMSDAQLAARAYFKAATLLNLSEKTIFCAGLAIMLVRAVDAIDDIDLDLSCEKLLCAAAVLQQHPNGTGDGSTIPSLAIRSRVDEARAMKSFFKGSNFSDGALRFGVTLNVVLDFIKPLLNGSEKIERFSELAWGVGARLFTYKSFEEMMEFLSWLENFPSRAQLYAHGEKSPQSWNRNEVSAVMLALGILFKEKNYSRGTQLAREMLNQFGMQMYPETFRHMQLWLNRSLFHWAFDGKAIEQKEIEDLVKDYQKCNTDREQLSYVGILAQRYNRWPQVAERLLTLKSTEIWRSARLVWARQIRN